MAGSKLKRVILVLVVLFVAAAGTLVGIFYSRNRQWYVAGRAAMKLQKLLAKEDGIDQGTMSFSLKLDFDKESVEGKGTFSFRKPDRFRMELDSTLGNYTIVSNQTISVHFRDRNAVLIADPEMSMKEAWLKPRFVLAGAAKTDASAKTVPQPRSCPSQSCPFDLTSRLEAKVPELKSYTVVLKGQETVPGFGKCHALSVEARSKDAEFQSALLWISPKHWLPVKATVEGPVKGSLEITQVSFAPVPDDRFTLNVSEDVQVQRVSMDSFNQLKTLLPWAQKQDVKPASSPAN